MNGRIFVAGLWHETNTFSAVPTDLDAFRRYQFAEGAELMPRYAGTNTEIGGIARGAAAAGLTIEPGLFAGAVPSGTITAEAFAGLCRRSRDLLRAAGPVDGAVLALHGAMVADGADEGDATYLETVAADLPHGSPVVATFDLHANLSQRLVDGAEVLIGYKTYPHRDMGICGEQAAAAMARVLETRQRPAKAFRKLPFVPAPQVQVTDDEPVASIMREAAAAEARDDVWSVSIAWGFPYADVGHLGVGVLVYADTQAAADAIADELSALIWERRADFDPQLMPVDAALDAAAGVNGGPAILVEVADNAGGGAPGDATPVLQALIERQVADAVIVIWDPAAVRQAQAAGPGGAFSGTIGGKSDDRHGAPVPVEGRVRFLGDVRYRRTGNYMTGQEVRLGPVAVIDANGTSVIVTTEKAMPFDNDHLRACGIVPEAMAVIVVKSAIAWRPHFRPFAAAEFYVDTPGIAASNLAHFAYAKVNRPLYPLDPAARWP